MDTNAIIAVLDAEIEKLEKAKALLLQTGKVGTTSKLVRTKLTGRRRLSTAAHARIAAAQRKRWAVRKKATE